MKKPKATPKEKRRVVYEEIYRIHLGARVWSDDPTKRGECYLIFGKKNGGKTFTGDSLVELLGKALKAAKDGKI